MRVDGVQLHRNRRGVAREIAIGREDLKASTVGRGAHQEVDGGTRDASGPARVAEGSGRLEVRRRQRLIVIVAETPFEALEGDGGSDAGKQLLTDGPDDRHAVVAD